MSFIDEDISASEDWYDGPGPDWDGGHSPSLDYGESSEPEIFISVQEVEDFIAANHVDDITAIEQDGLALLAAEDEARRLASYLRSEISALRGRLRDARTELYSIDQRLQVLRQARFRQGRCLITNLPAEVLDRIVSFLEVNDLDGFDNIPSLWPPWPVLWIDVKGLASSCKTLQEQCWHHLFRYIWLHPPRPYFSPYIGMPSLSRSAQLLRTLDDHPSLFAALRFLDMSGEIGVPSDARLLQGCSNLEGLVAGSWMHVTHAPASLRDLYLGDVSPSSLVDALPRLRRLRHLDLGGNDSSSIPLFRWFFEDPGMREIVRTSCLNSVHFALNPAKGCLIPCILATMGECVRTVSLGIGDWIGDVVNPEQLIPPTEPSSTCHVSTLVLSPNDWGNAAVVLQLLANGFARPLLSLRSIHLLGFFTSLHHGLPDALFSALPPAIDELVFQFATDNSTRPPTAPRRLVQSLLRDVTLYMPASQRIARRIEVWALPADDIEEHLSDLAMGCVTQGLQYRRHNKLKVVEAPQKASPFYLNGIIQIFWENEE